MDDEAVTPVRAAEWPDAAGEPDAPREPDAAGGAARRWVRTGWFRAFVGALIAAGVGLALAEAAAFAFAWAGGSAGSMLSVARAGGLLFYAFHHVPLSFGAGITTGAGATVAHLGVTLGVAPMLGTVVVGGALFVVGRSLARDAVRPAGGPSAIWLAAYGAKVALPYALVCAVGVPLVRLTVTPTGSALDPLRGVFTVGPVLFAAIAWSLVLAAVAGGLGAVTARLFDGPTATRPEGAIARRVTGAVVAGSMMTLIGLVLAFAGLLVMAAVDTHDTRTYFDVAFQGGPARGSAVVGLTALAVPNMATWVLYPSMGSCVAVARSAGSVARTASGGACVLSYRSLPTGAALAQAGSLGRALAPSSAAIPRGPPGAYLLFLLVPAVAVLAGGWIAARRSAGGTVPERLTTGAAAGALAGVVFVAWAPLLVLLSTISVTIAGAGAAGLGGEGTVAVGPPMLLSIAVAAAWGIVGGAAGGTARTLVARRSSTPVRERVFPEGSRV